MIDKRIVVKQEVNYNTNGRFDPVTIEFGYAEVSIQDIPPPKPLSDYTDEELIDILIDIAAYRDPYYEKWDADHEVVDFRAELLRRMAGD